MLRPKNVGITYSQVAVLDTEKDVETLGVDMSNSDEDIFLGCSINNSVYIVFNKHTKYIMESIKVLVNDVQTLVTPHEDENDDFFCHKVEQVVAYNIRGKLKSTK